MNDHKRILVVDDEEQIVSTLSRSLKKLGDQYEIVTAHNGHEALAKLRESPADLIITDLKMPGMDGVALTEVAYAILPGTKVIWMTARRLGIYRYFNKPLDMAELRQVVRETLEAASGSSGKDKTQARKHILILDDDPQEALALCGALDHAADGRYYVKISMVPGEALDSLSAETFDLVIASLHTPDEDNSAFIRRVRQLNSQMRAILIADHPSFEIEQQARQLAVTCLSGPLNLAKFAATVECVLSQKNNCFDERRREELR
jgi:DNA-binding NtrC family response regulator